MWTASSFSTSRYTNAVNSGRPNAGDILACNMLQAALLVPAGEARSAGHGPTPARHAGAAPRFIRNALGPAGCPCIARASTPADGRPLRTAAAAAATSAGPTLSGAVRSRRSHSAVGGVGPSASVPSAGSPTPRELGFRMPGEIEPHAGTWMAFPYDPFLWREAARPAQQQQAGIARAISQFEQVWMLADPQVYDTAKSLLRDASGVEVVRMPTNDVWVRDWGPTCIVRDDPATGEREVAAMHFDFDCYGSPAKMARGLPPLLPDWSKDRAAGRSLPKLAGIRAFECPVHLEGGAVQSDGQGTTLVTEECLLHWSRNPQLSRADNEAMLREYPGAERVVWLWKGMVGDEMSTNGHVDNVAAFAAPGTVLLAWSDDPVDPALREMCERNLEALQGAADARGRPLRVVKVPCPSPPMVVPPTEVNSQAAAALEAGYGTCLPEGARMAGSYINHYVVNGGVIVPQFGGKQSGSDIAALEALEAAYPDRRVVGVPSRELLLGGGNIHCLTQNLPAGRPAAGGALAR